MAANKRASQTDKTICEIACGEKACAIQYCLANYNYQESRCKKVIADWKECCDQAIAQNKEKMPGPPDRK